MAGHPRPGAPRAAWRTAPAASLKAPQRQPPRLADAGRAANGARAEVARPQSLVVAAGADAGRQNGGSRSDEAEPLPSRIAQVRASRDWSAALFLSKRYPAVTRSARHTALPYVSRWRHRPADACWSRSLTGNPARSSRPGARNTTPSTPRGYHPI